MGAIGLNPIRLDRIGLDPIRINAIKLGVPGASGSDRPYIDPEVLASLKAVCICYGKSNDDPDRAVVKNLVDPDNPFVISNAAFKLNSGFGKYEDDFTNWVAETGTKLTSDKITNSNPTKNWIAYRSSGVEFKEMHIRILGIPDNGVIYFQRPAADGGPIRMFNGDNNIPAFTSTGICGFFINNLTGLGWSNLVIEQIPSFEGAFVTDGVNDLITSTKSATEMLDGSNEITVVSMIHQVKDSANNVSFTNYIRGSANGYFRNIVNNYDKTGIYGYTSSDLMGLSVVNNILGDKNDYTANGDNRDSIINGNFSVQGYSYNDGNNTGDFSSVAWYWTIIANKVLTTDQINQVIAYFNLDRTLNPDILCNTIKQGITNENHAEFGDKLIDFSGNGRDIQLNNIAWKGDSGIGKYAADFTSWTTPKEVQKTSDTVKITTEYTEHWVAYLAPNNTFKSMKVLISGIPDGGSLQFFRTTADGGGIKMVNGINEIPEFTNTVAAGFYIDVPLGFDWSNLVIEQIPSHAGALCLDGVNDFGKVTGMPIYKDYTVVADYIRTSTKEDAQDSPILSKSQVVNNGAFAFNYLNINSALNSYSFGTNNGLESISDSERKIYYQSKYVNDGKSINSGTGIDYNSMWLGTYRDNVQIFFNGAIYSLMSFPYSMSEFLIERQLKKHKLGTLYPDMVEFRPVIKANANYNLYSTYKVDDDGAWTKIQAGDNVLIGSRIALQFSFDSDADELVSATSSQLSNITVVKNNSNVGYTVFGFATNKSPQKINITIYQPPEYLTMLSNSTLISNETLIKNE